MFSVSSSAGNGSRLSRCFQLSGPWGSLGAPVSTFRDSALGALAPNSRCPNTPSSPRPRRRPRPVRLTNPRLRFGRDTMATRWSRFLDARRGGPAPRLAAYFRFRLGSTTALRPLGKGGVPWGHRAGVAPAGKAGGGAGSGLQLRVWGRGPRAAAPEAAAHRPLAVDSACGAPASGSPTQGAQPGFPW